jgi:hypothetical protein
MSDLSSVRILPEPSRAERKVASGSRGHCVGLAALGRGAGFRVQAESHLERNHLFLLNADPTITVLK